jgi:[acyl-carrier-protein] S-malonyltransferase
MARTEELAVLFPGQGSQTADMREAVERERPDLLELAHELVGEDPFKRVGQGTRFDQPAIYSASLAGFERLGRPEAAFYAGHSLGEIAALAAAGALSEADGLGVVAERGRLMQLASERADGGMVALRAGASQAAGVADRAGACVANDNAPDQVVLSASEDALGAVERLARESGLRAKRLPVRGAFHSPLLEPVLPEFRAALEAIEVGRPRVPVLSCVTAAPFDDVRARLAEALVRPVRWLAVMRALHAAGVRRFVETGPGRVLAGLVRRSLPDVEVLAPEAARA